MDKNLKKIYNWNENNPPGTKVRVTRPNGTTFEAHTTGKAQFIAVNVPVVSIDDNCLCRRLKDVEAI